MPFELDFLPVGDFASSGDAICLRYGDAYSKYKLVLIDGGYIKTADTIKSHIRNYYDDATHIDHVILTHADRDHAAGLVEIMNYYSVGALWMHRPWLYSAEIIHHFHGNWTVDGLRTHLRNQYSILADLEEIALSKGVPIYEPFQGAIMGPFIALAPSRQRYLDLLPDFDKTPTKKSEASLGDVLAKAFMEAAKAVISWISETWSSESLSNNPDPTTASNESSIVQGAFLDGKRFVLTADVGPQGLTEAADYATLLGHLQPDLIQIPHHGSRRNVTPNVLDRWLGEPVDEHSGVTRGFSVCSAANKDETHPRKRVINAFLRRGYSVHITNGNTINWNEGMPARSGFGPAASQEFSTQVEA